MSVDQKMLLSTDDFDMGSIEGIQSLLDGEKSLDAT